MIYGFILLFGLILIQQTPGQVSIFGAWMIAFAIWSMFNNTPTPKA